MQAGAVYAEIEVMKMLMELRANVSGVLRQQKRNGAVLELGAIIGRLEVDDENLVQKVINPCKL